MPVYQSSLFPFYQAESYTEEQSMIRRKIRNVLIATGLMLCVAPIITLAVTAVFWAQRADYGWTPHVPNPRYTTWHPRVAVDAAHGNASTIGFANRYWPFAQLLRADGFEVVPGEGVYTSSSLTEIDVLVIANASGASKSQAFGINISLLGDSDHDRSASAFTKPEIEALRAWVEKGGSLLLIADHAPFGASASDLASAFGVKMFKGFVEVPGELSDPLLFARSNNRLGDHPILANVGRVMTFTGQSLKGPEGAVNLLQLPESAIEYLPTGRPNDYDSVAAGPSQGLALEVGDGRVVVLGEAAMLTAQVSNRIPFGMNSEDNDNQQFALNVMHWLAQDL